VKNFVYVLLLAGAVAGLILLLFTPTVLLICSAVFTGVVIFLFVQWKKAGKIGAQQAQQKHLASLSVNGAGLQRVVVTVRSRTWRPLSLRFPKGTIVRSASSAVQDMVLTDDNELFVTPYATKSSEVDAACMNMTRKEPKKADRLTIDPEAIVPLPIAKLITSPLFKSSSYRIRQFAIWIITDDPLKSGFTGIGNAGAVLGALRDAATADVGSQAEGLKRFKDIAAAQGPPTEKEFFEVEALFKEVGLNPADYRAFGTKA
jgi:hypothetical protein